MFKQSLNLGQSSCFCPREPPLQEHRDDMMGQVLRRDGWFEMGVEVVERFDRCRRCRRDARARRRQRASRVVHADSQSDCGVLV